MSRKLTYDTYLFGAAMLIVVVGMVMIYSASAIITMQKVGSDNPYYFISRQLVWLNLGSMNVASEPGRGATFLIYLPIAMPAEEAAPAETRGEHREKR